MMKTQLTNTLCAVMMVLSVTAFSQTEHIQLSWTELPTEKADVVCYGIQLDPLTMPANAVLGSQNYRFYYDGRQIKLRKDLSGSMMTDISYSDIEITQDIYDSNAQGFGALSFDDHLSFVNFSINDGGEPTKMVSLSTEVSVMTARVCFDELLPGAKEIVWSRAGVTEGYATAFTEISYYDVETRELHKAYIRYLDSEASTPSATDQKKMVTKQ